MIVLALEEFAPRRRSQQARIEQSLRRYIQRALDGKVNTDGYNELIAQVRRHWAAAYVDQVPEGEQSHISPSPDFIEDVRDTLRKTDRPTADPNTVDIIATWLATAILSNSTVTAADDADDDIELEWVDMNDDRVRHTHHEANGQTVKVGEPFKVGGHDMPYPGYPGVPMKEWINCRCSVRAKHAAQSLVAAGKIDSSLYCSSKDVLITDDHFVVIPQVTTEQMMVALAEEMMKPLDEPTHAGLAVQASDTGRVLLIQRSLDQEDPPDVQGTWEFPGGTIEEGDESPEAAARREFAEEVGREAPEGEITGGWRSANGVYQGFVLTVDIEAEAFEDLNGSAPDVVNPDDPDRRKPDVAAWFSLEQIQALGPNLRPEVHDTDWSQFSPSGGDVWHSDEDSEEEPDMPEKTSAAQALVDRMRGMQVTPEERAEIDKQLDLATRLPSEFATDDPTKVAERPQPMEWHSVWTVEGKKTGDGRRFAPGKMRARPGPLPLTWQKFSDDGHKGNVTVGPTTRLTRKDGEIRASGTWLSNAEADEVIGLLAEFGRFGISVDADDATMSLSEDEEIMDFVDSRACSACIVPIPAFAEAWIALGPPPEDFHGDDLEVRGPNDTEAMVASMQAEDDAFWAEFADLAPGRTEDGPGWLTHPVDTDRLRDYWVSGPGAAKIGWGTPGDFNRCRALTAEYVKPQHINGYCANRHFDALGDWPGRGAHAADTLELTDRTPAPALNLVASAGPYGRKAPAEWFKVPEPDHVQPLTITEDGQVYGHVADWTTCHGNSGQYGECTLAPRSKTNYAGFLLGGVLTDEGLIPCGSLTIGGGHAGLRLSMKAAQRHYDDSTAAWADVTAMDGKHGIWVCGWVRPGTTEEMVIAARASKLSGDWRYDASVDNHEMIAALCVNTPGFQIPRVAASVQDGKVYALVAAGVVVDEEQDTLPEGFSMEAFADAVCDRILERQAAEADLDAIREEYAPVWAAEMEALQAEFAQEETV